MKTVFTITLLWVPLAGSLLAQAVEPPRRLSVAQTGCDTLKPASNDTVYDADAVDEPVQAVRLQIKDMQLRIREVLVGHSSLLFVVESSGWIDRCTIELVEETDPAWTATVLKELRSARYRPARRGGQKVRQRVYQIFTYNQDGRFLHSQ